MRKLELTWPLPWIIFFSIFLPQVIHIQKWLRDRDTAQQVKHACCVSVRTGIQISSIMEMPSGHGDHKSQRQGHLWSKLARLTRWISKVWVQVRHPAPYVGEDSTSTSESTHVNTCEHTWTQAHSNKNKRIEISAKGKNESFTETK